ncbi:MAG: hypothetical protein V4594_18770 [Bacteroidota bacterium]
MKLKITALTIAIVALCSLASSAQTKSAIAKKKSTSAQTKSTSAQTKSIVGTWKLVSQKVTYPDGNSFIPDSTKLNALKIYTPTTFVNVSQREIPEMGNQKIVVSCTGGRYSLIGNVYEEFTEFASFKDYKDLKVKFNLTLEKGRMHTVGSLSGADGIVTIYDEWFVKVD